MGHLMTTFTLCCLAMLISVIDSQNEQKKTTEKFSLIKKIANISDPNWFPPKTVTTTKPKPLTEPPFNLNYSEISSNNFTINSNATENVKMDVKYHILYAVIFFIFLASASLGFGVMTIYFVRNGYPSLGIGRFFTRLGRIITGKERRRSQAQEEVRKRALLQKRKRELAKERELELKALDQQKVESGDEDAIRIYNPGKTKDSMYKVNESRKLPNFDDLYPDFPRRVSNVNEDENSDEPKIFPIDPKYRYLAPSLDIVNPIHEDSSSNEKPDSKSPFDQKPESGIRKRSLKAKKQDKKDSQKTRKKKS